MPPGSTHVLRASDGSHYVAFIAQPPAATPLPAGPAAALRAARDTPRRRAACRTIADSRVARRHPHRPRRRSREAASRSATCRSWAPPATSSAAPPPDRRPDRGMVDLQLLTLERRTGAENGRRNARAPAPRRARRQDRRRRPRSLPFEDFDLASRSIGAGGARVISARADGGPRRLRPLPRRGPIRPRRKPAVDDPRRSKKSPRLCRRHQRRLDDQQRDSRRRRPASATAPYPPPSRPRIPTRSG